MTHKRTHLLAEQVKQNRLDKKNKEKQRKEKAKRHLIRSILTDDVVSMTQLLDKLDIIGIRDSRALHMLIKYAESDPMFLQENWKEKQ
jgi:hypothetical protein